MSEGESSTCFQTTVDCEQLKPQKLKLWIRADYCSVRKIQWIARQARKKYQFWNIESAKIINTDKYRKVRNVRGHSNKLQNSVYLGSRKVTEALHKSNTWGESSWEFSRTGEKQWTTDSRSPKNSSGRIKRYHSKTAEQQRKKVNIKDTQRKAIIFKKQDWKLTLRNFYR